MTNCIQCTKNVACCKPFYRKKTRLSQLYQITARQTSCTKVVLFLKFLTPISSISFDWQLDTYKIYFVGARLQTLTSYAFTFWIFEFFHTLQLLHYYQPKVNLWCLYNREGGQSVLDFLCSSMSHPGAALGSMTIIVSYDQICFMLKSSQPTTQSCFTAENYLTNWYNGLMIFIIHQKKTYT